MWPFGKKHKEKKVIAWLTEVDDKFVKAVQYKQPLLLDKYLDTDTLEKISGKILTGDYKGGLSKYREITLEYIETFDGYEMYAKKVTYKNIKVTARIYVPCGTEHTEYWTISKENNSYLVVAVEGV